MKLKVTTMLQTHILFYLMQREATSSLRKGRLLGYPVAPLMHECGVPKATFYRAVNELLAEGFIVKQKRGYYLVSQHVRKVANGCKIAENVTR